MSAKGAVQTVDCREMYWRAVSTEVRVRSYTYVMLCWLLLDRVVVFP